MQALCVRLAVSDAIIAYLFGYIRSFFPRQILPGNTWYELATYILIYYNFFIRAIRKSGIALKTRIYIIYILFCLIGFMNFSPQLCVLFDKIRRCYRSVSITIHFILIVFFSDTRIHTFIVFALIFTFLLSIFFFPFVLNTQSEVG